jgi:hypothetical protein
MARRNRDSTTDARHKRASELASKGMTFKDVAAELGVTPHTISSWFKTGKSKIKVQVEKPVQFVLPALKISDPGVQKAATDSENGGFALTAAREYRVMWFALNQQIKEMLESGALTSFKEVKEGITTQMMLGKYIEETEAARPAGSTLDEISQMNELQQRRQAADKLYRKEVSA